MKIALLGMGTIGSGVYEHLEELPGIEVRRILDRRILPGWAESLRTESFEDILSDPEIDTVVETLGGVHPAFEFAMGALSAGKNLVTANKLMVGHDFGALTAEAKNRGAELRISSSVGGGIPWLSNLLRIKRIDRITSLSGIMNGTTNYILDKMHSEGVSYSKALAQAQKSGYAEADPVNDVSGYDTACKLSISLTVLTNTLIRPGDIPRLGLEGILDTDIAAFDRMGRVCRLIAFGRIAPSGIEAGVYPALFPVGSREASIRSNDNLFTYTAEKAGAQSYIGQGAGKCPTACQLVNDLVDIQLGSPAPVYLDSPCVGRIAPPPAMRWYLRAKAELPFAAEALSDSSYRTAPIGIDAMEAHMRAIRKADPAAFAAAIQE